MGVIVPQLFIFHSQIEDNCFLFSNLIIHQGNKLNDNNYQHDESLFLASLNL